MKTKFILHGGFSVERRNEDNSDFYAEILKDAPQDVKVLIVPFAQEADRVPAAAEKVAAEFDNSKGEKSITVSVATEENLLRQIQMADVIYFHGGVSLRLLKVLKNFPGLEGFLKGKIIAGESAGANVFGQFFFSPHANGVFAGLGILPFKINPHYKKEYEGRLDAVGPGSEALLLPEYTYKVFYQ